MLDALKKVSEYDQEMPQSHTADQPTAPSWGRFTERQQKQDIKKTIKAKQPALSLFLVKVIAMLEKAQSKACQNKDQHRTPTNNGKYIKQWININRSNA